MSLILNRRGALAMAGVVAVRRCGLSAARVAERRVEAVAFDAFTIFDPRSVVR
jgi:hypothetical protein